MMPLLYSLGQHGALQDVSRRLGRGEHLFDFLDDTYIVFKPTRVAPIYRFLERALWRLVGIQIHVGKIQIWNQAGIRPDICDALERSAQAVNPSARLWRGSMVPIDRQGIKLLGTPLGHPDYVARHLLSVVEEHRVLLTRIPRVKGFAECLASLAALCISSGQLHASFSGPRQDWRIRTSPRRRYLAVCMRHSAD